MTYWWKRVSLAQQLWDIDLLILNCKLFTPHAAPKLCKFLVTFRVLFHQHIKTDKKFRLPPVADLRGGFRMLDPLFLEKKIEIPGKNCNSRACIVYLVIKRTNWSFVKTMSCSGSHLGIPNNIKNHKVCKGPSNDWCTVYVQSVQ